MHLPLLKQCKVVMVCVCAAEKYLCETKALILRANLMKHDLAQKNPQQGPPGGRRASTTGFFGGMGGMGALQAFEAGMAP